MAPIATDNCGSLTYEKTTGNFVQGQLCPQAGTYTNTWIAKDACLNTSTVFTQIITIYDNTAPTWTTSVGNLDRTVQCSDGSALESAQVLAPSASDNCDAYPWIFKTPGTFVPSTLCPQAGTYTNTWVAEDHCGNPSIVYTQVITIIDNTPPTFTRPADITINSTANCSYNADPSITGDVTDESDNCSYQLNATYTDVVTSGSCLGVYSIARTWHLIDACGNQAPDQVQTITVLDVIAPAFEAPADITVYTDANCTYNSLPAVTGTPVYLWDNCTQIGSLVVNFTDATVPGFCPGSFDITRTWKVADCVGNFTEHVQLIHVSDNIPPVIIHAGPFVRCATTTYSTYTTVGTEFDMSFSDNCYVENVNYSFNGATTSSIPYTSLAGVVFNAGVTHVHLVVSDCAQNTDTYDYTITINPLPTPFIVGDTAICCNTLATYCDPNGYPGDGFSYEWTIVGGTIQNGGNTPCVQVLWNCNCSEGWLKLTKKNLITGCEATTPPFHVTIYAQPSPIINGPTTVYTNATGTHYWLTNCTPGHLYSWTVEGGTITGGWGTCEIWVDWNWPYCDTCGTVCVTETSLHGCVGSSCIHVNQIAVPGANTLKGQLTYDNTSNTPLNGVTLKLLQGGVVKATTITYSAIDETDPLNPVEVPGYYEFSGLNNGIYTLNATTTKAWGGVNATDALLIKLHAISSPLLTGLPLLAADVNLSSIANATDALLVQLRTVGRVGSFAAGNWVFGSSPITISANTTYNFVALATGDVNKSYVPEVGYKAVVYTNLQKEGVVQTNGQEIEIPIRVNDAFSLGAVTLDLSYDQTLVDVSDITSQLSGFEYKISNGKIMLAWANSVPVSLQANDVLLTLKVIAKSAINISSDIFSMSDKTEFADGNGNILGFNLLKVNSIQSDTKTNDISIYPNPFQNNTEINYNLIEAGNVNISLYNVVGQRTEILVNEFKNIGNYKISLNTSDIPSGVYSCEIIINGQTSDYKKVIKLVRTK